MLLPHFRYRVNGCLDVGLQSEVLVVGLQTQRSSLTASGSQDF